MYVLHRLHCLRQLKEKKINSLQFQFINYNNIIVIKKEANKETEQTNKFFKLNLDQNCTEENYY